MRTIGINKSSDQTKLFSFLTLNFQAAEAYAVLTSYLGAFIGVSAEGTFEAFSSNVAFWMLTLELVNILFNPIQLVNTPGFLGFSEIIIIVLYS